jgi:hypothetical protein
MFIFDFVFLHHSEELEDEDLEEPHAVDESLGDAMIRCWKRRENIIISDPVIAAWAMCVMPEVRKDCKERMTGCHRDAIDRVLEKMHAHDPSADLDDIKDVFWTEFKAFQDETHPFDKKNRWNTRDVQLGRLHVWHGKYSEPHTKYLGWFGMRWGGKYTGIGNCERAWGHLKHLKNGKRKHLSARAVEMQSIIYTTARINEARIRELEFENHVSGDASRMWSDDDINFDLQLENFGVDTTVLRSVSRNRIYKCWFEEWEKVAVKKNDPVQESKLLQKYKDLIFYDPDTKVNFTIHPGNMEYQRGRSGGWMAIGIPPDGCGLDEEPFQVGEMLIDMIADTQQADNITMVRMEEEQLEVEGADGDSDVGSVPLAEVVDGDEEV